MTLTVEEEQRLFGRVRLQPSGCWEWVGARDKGGYGRVSLDGRTVRTHRIMFVAFQGPIPDGLECHHRCRNRACCNPAHLELLSRHENASLAQQRTHCKRGHEFTPETTRFDSDGKRRCRICASARDAERRSRPGFLAERRTRYAEQRDEINARRREQFAADPELRERRRKYLREWRARQREHE